MVAGDLVNTASRIQSLAPPGTVLVGEATRSASASAIAYEDAGLHELKGKSEPIRLWRPARILGEEAAGGLEPPFVGRERELRLVKESFHACDEGRRAHLVSIIGPPGSGKSRLAAEFSRYLEGLVGDTYWHRGRCPAYGDGLTYWALAEMVRMRCGIAEEETGPGARSKLRVLLEKEVADPDERRWIEPRLASLIGLEEGATGDRDELFSAWRLLFERLADRDPTALVFEDLENADSSLVDFIEYLLEWSRNSRLFVMTLSRPELLDRRPTWATGKGDITSIYLEPLDEEQMRELLSRTVAELPRDVEAAILERAQGIPLYAVETIRMLLDRGLLAQEGSTLRPTGPIEHLHVPDTLHALIAARLDGLTPEERSIVLDAAVLGKSFVKEGVAAVSGQALDVVESVLTGLVRKDVFTLQSDPRSPERGQFTFIQELVRQVAYGTIAKRDRKSKHLAAARFLSEGWQGDQDEAVEVVAAHLLRAYELDPSAADAGAIKAGALDMLRRAGERAAALGANREAQGYFTQAAALTDDILERALLIERSGEMALAGMRLEEAEIHLREALEVYEARSLPHPAARASARLAEADLNEGRLDEAVERMEKALSVLSQDEPDEDLAMLAAQLGRLLFFRGQLDTAMARIDTALEVAEELVLPEVLSQALNTKGIILGTRSPQQETAFVAHALKIALEHDLTDAALRAYNNLAEDHYRLDLFEDALRLFDEGIALAKRVGNRLWLDLLLCERPIPLFMLGRWDEALADVAERSTGVFADILGEPSVVTLIHVNRRDLDAAAEILARFARYEDSKDVQEHLAWVTGGAVVAHALGDHRAACDLAQEAIESGSRWVPDSIMVKVGIAVGVDAALALGDVDSVGRIIDEAERLPSIRWSPVTSALVQQANARLYVATGETDSVDGLFAGALDLFRQTGARFWLATTLAHRAEWLRASGREDEARLACDEARSIFEHLGASVWLDRVGAVA
jgi:predicted ATPase